ncbi:hypothetical protein B0H10DRAFT_252042 [Mycena sp. CBHHK59/15]|nr:hypothetical protein B0H10DRAFT_292157 [Mycena sp. CBHHK59/15]KAJ6613128.1 hypothetical protein B0H10DRAFT_252042 [Mycena sp. CBHHK59/15]
MYAESSDYYYPAGRMTPTARRQQRPTPAAASAEEVTSLTFVCGRKRSANYSTLNCTVMRRIDACPYFHIMTHAGTTVVRTNKGSTVAAVEWHGRGEGGGADVEVGGVVGKQPVSTWLGISEDASYRVMHAYGQTYVWVPQHDSICLYHWDPMTGADVPRLLARIVKEKDSDNGDVVTLEITLDAIRMGLLELSVVCVVLFQSGCSID